LPLNRCPKQPIDGNSERLSETGDRSEAAGRGSLETLHRSRVDLSLVGELRLREVRSFPQ
jgi:hypothetical protein